MSNFLIGDEEFPYDFNMQFSADRVEISYEGKYYYVNYEDYDAGSRLGNAIFEFAGPYELVDLPPESAVVYIIIPLLRKRDNH